MKRFYFLLVVIFFPFFASSQCYSIQQRPYYPDPYSGGISAGILSAPGVLTDDVYSSVVDLGFPFCFFGDTVTQCVISSNGFISFDTSLASTGSPWSINGSIPGSGPVFSIMAPWQDLNPGTPGSGPVRFVTYGVPPYRRFIVSYDAVSMFSCTTITFTNQIVIYESMNVVDINIADKPLCANWNDGVAIEGILNQDRTEGYAVPGRNFPEQWTAQYDSYRFTPLCDCPTDSLNGLGIVPGKVFWDENSDCELTQGEWRIPNVQIDIQPGNGIAWTNNNGEFGVLMEPGNYTFTHSSQNPWYLINDCQNGSIPVTIVADSNAVDICFGDSIVPVIDLAATITTGAINACFNNSQHVSICNYGTIPATNVVIELEIPSFTGTSNSSFTSTSDSTWTLNLPTLNPGSCLTYNFTGIAACDSSMIGQVACLSISISSSDTDVDPSNNQMWFCDSVGVSYDPNDIRVLSQYLGEGWRTQEYIDDSDEMTYMVRFQNTGTGPAYNVIVKNPLSSHLNHQSIELVAASHDYYAQMTDGELSVHFLGIQLPDSASDPLGSQGYFIYRINQPYGNPMGTLIENQAEIYFDFNAPVVTNTTENEIQLITGNDEVAMGEISLYPNPTTGEVFLSNSSPRNAVLSVEVIDTQGRLLSKETGSGISKVDMRTLSTGIYLLRIQTEKGMQVERVIKN
ncbi:MAG: T9SS type A sorting domain-containing protein [Flavobacteriales bacterium]|nr:T9SS type A sorting domain-containing protein [Flavobacteriales bacterium]